MNAACSNNRNAMTVSDLWAVMGSKLSTPDTKMEPFALIVEK
jgi:hypothetical protein